MDKALEEMRIKNPIKVNQPTAKTNQLLARRTQKKTQDGSRNVPSTSTLNLRSTLNSKDDSDSDRKITVIEA